MHLAQQKTVEACAFGWVLEQAFQMTVLCLHSLGEAWVI